MIKRMAWILAGLVLGGFITGTVMGVRAQGRPQPRLVTVAGGVNSVEQSNAYFIKDTKTGACWLMVRARDDNSGALAPAPQESCQY